MFLLVIPTDLQISLILSLSPPSDFQGSVITHNAPFIGLSLFKTPWSRIYRHSRHQPKTMVQNRRQVLRPSRISGKGNCHQRGKVRGHRDGLVMLIPIAIQGRGCHPPSPYWGVQQQPHYAFYFSVKLRFSVLVPFLEVLCLLLSGVNIPADPHLLHRTMMGMRQQGTISGVTSPPESFRMSYTMTRQSVQVYCPELQTIQTENDDPSSVVKDSQFCNDGRRIGMSTKHAL